MDIDPWWVLTTYSRDVAYVADEDGCLTWLSDALPRVLGWQAEELLGRPLRDLVHPDDREAAMAWRALLASRPTEEGVSTDPLRFRRSDGSYLWCGVSAARAFDEAGAPIGITGSVHDVDDLVRARIAAADAHALLHRVIDSQVDPHVLLSAVRGAAGEIVDFTYLDANEAAAAYEGVPRERMVGASVMDVYHDPVEAAEDIADCIRALESYRPVLRNEAPTLGYVDDAGRPIVTDNRIVPIDAHLVSYTWRDVTDRHAAQQALAESEERFRLLAENMTDIVALIRDVTIAWVSPSVTRTLGWSTEDLIGQSPAIFTHPEDMERVIRLWQAVPEGDLPRQRYRMVTREGAVRWVDAEGRIIRLDPRTVVITARVVDAEVAALRALEDMARHDELTGLVNRHAVFDQVARSLQGDQRSGSRVAMVFCDLDGFKAVNDTYGHSSGDVLLRSIARRLERAVRSADVVARIGGDELLVVLNGVRDLDDALGIAEKLRVEVCQPTLVPGGTVTVSASIGVAVAEPGETVDDVVARADAAMYEAKRSGKDRVVG